MKINRFFGMAVIALLVVGAMGALTYHALAQGNHNPVTQTQDCTQDQAEDTEVQTAAADTDNVELQCGDQSSVETEETTGAADINNVNIEDQVSDQGGVDTTETVGETDTDNVNVEEQVGDQNAPDTGGESTEVDQP
jgi:hypothetical protein